MLRLQVGIINRYEFILVLPHVLLRLRQAMKGVVVLLQHSLVSKDTFRVAQGPLLSVRSLQLSACELA